MFQKQACYLSYQVTLDTTTANVKKLSLDCTNKCTDDGICFYRDIHIFLTYVKMSLLNLQGTWLYLLEIQMKYELYDFEALSSLTLTDVPATPVYIWHPPPVIDLYMLLYRSCISCAKKSGVCFQQLLTFCQTNISFLKIKGHKNVTFLIYRYTLVQ